jgi:hypothetical protein
MRRRSIRVTLPDGSDVDHPIDERTTIGSSAEATIAIDGEPGLDAEHLMLVPRDDGCWVSVVRGAKTPVMCDGAVITDGVAPWGATLAIASIRIELGSSAPGARKARGRSPVLMAMIVGVAALVAFAAMRSRDARAEAIEDETERTVLFDAPRGCGVAAEVALAHASETLRVARARGERFAFDPQDGIAAVALYEEAGACFLSAGAVPWAETAAHEGRTLREQIDGTYRRLRFALVQQLQRGRDREALETVRELRTLTSHRDDAYTQGLVDLDRSLQLGLGLIHDENDEEERR